MLSNVVLTSLIMIILGVLWLTNTVLGIILNSTEFNSKKLTLGVVKGLVLFLTMISFCICIEYLPVLMKRLGIQMSESLITPIEVITILTTAYKKYALDCYDKIKKIFKIGKGD